MLTVTAKDSSSAMDEIVSKLGSDALIVSTRRVDGGIEITATSDILDLSTRLKKKENGPITFQSNRSENNKDQILFDNIERKAVGNPADLGAKATILKDIEKLLDEYERNLKVCSDSNFLGPTLSQQDDNSRFKRRFMQLSYSREKFIEIFSRDIVDHDYENIFNSKLFYVVGLSGSGKSTFAAKLIYMLKDKNKDAEFLLWEANRNNFVEQSILSFCAKITGQSYKDDQFETTNDDKINIVEVDLSTFLMLQEKNLLGDKPTIFLTIPAGLGRQSIGKILENFKMIKPKMVFTKLDESDVNFDEIVEMFNFNCKLLFLSANSKLSEGLCFATNEIMSWFLTDRVHEGNIK